MKSRIVQPAPSFQPPDTCTEHEECLAGQASNADLCRAAQAHYDKISSATHEWHSAIPKAIAAYYIDPERSSLKREALDCLLAWYTEKDPSKRSVAWIRMLAAAGDLAAFLADKETK